MQPRSSNDHAGHGLAAIGYSFIIVSVDFVASSHARIHQARIAGAESQRTWALDPCFIFIFLYASPCFSVPFLTCNPDRS